MHGIPAAAPLSSPTHTTRPLRGLYVTQFLGAFNDNAFKLIVALLAMRAVDALDPSLSTLTREMHEQVITARAFLVFSIPLIVLSLPAGLLADRIAKRSQIVLVKCLELVLMAAGTVILVALQDPGAWLFVVLAGLGVHSALFSPAKYGIVPELVPHKELSRANGLLETWTMVAIIAGSAAGPLLLERAGPSPWIALLVLTCLAVVGLWFSTTIPRVSVVRKPVSLGRTLSEGFEAVRTIRVLRLAILGLAVFWCLATAVGQIVFAHAHTGLGLSKALAGLPLAVMGLGFGVGALAAARLSQNRVELGLVPLGGIGFTIVLVLLGSLDPGRNVAIALMFLLGCASGLLVIPLNSLVQWQAPEDRRGSVIGVANVLQYGGMLLGTLGPMFAAPQGVSVAHMLLGLGVFALFGTLWALWLLPEALLRLVLVLVARTIYRLRVTGLENVPEKGAALFAPNHVAMIDGLFLMAVIDRPIRFLIDRAQYELWWQKPFMKALDAIPISASGGPREILRALREAGKHLDEGHLVCIFPEGQLTRTGMMQPFRRGMERIARGHGAPIIPIYLGGVWGSIFSGAHGKFVTKVPEQIPYPVSIAFGAPMPDSSSAAQVRRAVVDLSETAWRKDAETREPLHRAFMRTARRHPGQHAAHDALSGEVSRVKLLTGAIALARHFRARWSDETAIGILLPPSVASISLNIACAIAGKPSVNLNYTAGRAGMESAAKQAGLKRIITSRAFFEKAKLELPTTVEIVFLEDERKEITSWSKLRALMSARFASVASIERSCGATRAPKMDDVVTIIFSSGSTGEPKGVPLTHANLAANAAGIAQVFGGRRGDGLLGILPLFHSFGYLAAWFALIEGIFIAAQPNPLDAAAVGEIVESKKLTLMICTPTFLQIYMRRVAPAQFGSLRIVMAGAEKMPERLAVAFEERFGIRPIEGYGTTECSPAVAVSTPTVRTAGIHQPGSKKGSVGQPLPGVTLKVVNPDTFAELPAGEPGMLLVRGANVMSGYLGRPDLSAQVLRDGWYVTGDIAVLDDEGYLRITDRLSRFSKIGGEMVPHGKVEDALQQAAGADVQVFAVTALPDEKKGERLAVLTTLDADKLPAVLEKLSKMGLPNLFVPRLDAFVKVDALPVLGTGKIDLKRVKQIAAEQLTARAG